MKQITARIIVHLEVPEDLTEEEMQHLVRAELATLLEPGTTLTLEIDDPASIVAAAQNTLRRLNPDLLVLDVGSVDRSPYVVMQLNAAVLYLLERRTETGEYQPHLFYGGSAPTSADYRAGIDAIGPNAEPLDESHLGEDAFDVLWEVLYAIVRDRLNGAKS